MWMSVLICLCDRLGAVLYPVRAGVASSLLWMGNIVCGKWFNRKIIVNGVKYLIEEGFEYPHASA